MPIITIGIDLAKNIFAVLGVNENGHAALVKPKVPAISSCRSSPIYRRVSLAGAPAPAHTAGRVISGSCIPIASA